MTSYQVSIYIDDSLFDQFQTGTKANAEKQGNQVAKWARYYHPEHIVTVKIDKVSGVAQ